MKEATRSNATNNPRPTTFGMIDVSPPCKLGNKNKPPEITNPTRKMKLSLSLK